ncbi:hypothetical protein COY95_04080 [Candidatus Woesearchaeota archaeon CG_4_10_14_0_8_um_filter_47_5]|nr:MAG: hypothetical protein COY95_04080 [Candidatus Woesearchaeota archaeon CG_4_10_14_0_8_um_filter_47_5]
MPNEDSHTENPQSHEAYEAEFVQHLLSLQTTGFMFLGKIQNPLTGTSEKNLAAAQKVIDTLLMLKAKTAGNLSVSEESMLTTIITQLELNFVDEAQKSEKELVKEQAGEKKAAKEQAEDLEGEGYKGKDQAQKEQREEYREEQKREKSYSGKEEEDGQLGKMREKEQPRKQQEEEGEEEERSKEHDEEGEEE